MTAFTSKDEPGGGAARRRAHSTPDPETPPSQPHPTPPPTPDDVPAPTHAPVEEPTLPEPPIRAG
jgi:hypothetical protein